MGLQRAWRRPVPKPVLIATPGRMWFGLRHPFDARQGRVLTVRA
jgi:hypothetical protein